VNAVASLPARLTSASVQRSIVVSGAPATLAEIAEQLDGREDVISLAWHRGASLQPRGDLLVAEVLNRSTDGVIHMLADAVERREIVVCIKPTSTLIDRARREEIYRDADDVVWEEVESDLRGQGRLSASYVVLMSLGAALCAAGLSFGALMKGTLFIGGSIIAPALEPLAKVTLGVVLRRWQSFRFGLYALGVGYLAMVASSAAVWGLLRLTSHGAQALTIDQGLSDLLTTGASSWVISVAAALAGGLIVTSLRETVIIGPVIALALVPGAALVGAGVAAGDFTTAGRAAVRVAVDIVSIFGGCAGVFLYKRWRRQRDRVVG
jgi:hypothetical protein